MKKGSQVIWELWLHPDGRHCWRWVGSQWYRPPVGTWSRFGTFRLKLWGKNAGLHREEIPRLPEGAIPAGSLEQNYGMGGPHYLYTDIQRTCRACGVDFAFTASEQKHWFETLQLWNEIIPRVCRACRRKKRHNRISHARLAEAIRRLKVSPDDEDAHLQAARATAMLAESIGLPALQRGIGFARRAARRSDLAEDAKAFEETIAREIQARSD